VELAVFQERLDHGVSEGLHDPHRQRLPSFTEDGGLRPED
jgi:hypothetical protein